jgi:hypothetical protein
MQACADGLARHAPKYFLRFVEVHSQETANTSHLSLLPIDRYLQRGRIIFEYTDRRLDILRNEELGDTFHSFAQR